MNKERNDLKQKKELKLTCPHCQSPFAIEDLLHHRDVQDQVDALTEQRLQERLQREVKKELKRELDKERLHLKHQLTEDMRKEAYEHYQWQLGLKDKKIKDIEKQLDEAKITVLSDRQNNQGKVTEEAIFKALQEAWPEDEFQWTKTGAKGGDIIQSINGPMEIGKKGQEQGKVQEYKSTPKVRILWEIKNTKSFRQAWISKAAQDRDQANAAAAVILTLSMPAIPGGKKDTNKQGLQIIDGIYIVPLQDYYPVATILRQNLLEMFSLKQSNRVSEEGLKQFYDYLVSPVFKKRLKGMVDSYRMMNQELQREKDYLQKMWLRREKQLSHSLDSAMGLWRDLHSVEGSPLMHLEEDFE